MIIVLVLYLLPVLELLHVAFKSSAVTALLVSSDFANLALKTVLQSALSTGVSALIGIVLGVVFSRAVQKKEISVKVLRVVLSVPYFVSTGLIALGWIQILNGSTVLFSWTAVILAHIGLNAPWVALNVMDRALQVDLKEKFLASSLGVKSKLKIFYDIDFKMIRSAFLQSVLQVYSLCLTSFVLVNWLGGGVETLETRLFFSIHSVDFNLDVAIACALMSLILSFVPVMLLMVLKKRDQKSKKFLAIHENVKTKKVGYFYFILAALWLLPILPAFKISGLLKLIRMDGFPWQEFKVSLFLGLSVSFATLLLSLVWVYFNQSKVLARSKLLVAISGSSSLVLSLGVFLVFKNLANTDAFIWSYLAVTWVQTVVFTPFAVRYLDGAFVRPEKRAILIARISGASRVQSFFDIEWPRLVKPSLFCFMICLSASLGEIAALQFFWLGDGVRPLPVLMGDLMSKYRFEEALGVATLVFIIGLFFVLISQLRIKKVRF